MKKHLLALSVAAAFGAGSSAVMAHANDDTGAVLVVPYYTVQNGNNTLINIVNTDSVNGKALKVRFRGAERSDDVFDFQLFLSPSDVWTANVSMSDDGVAQLYTEDNSCTLPADVNQPFVTTRLADPANGAGTREGYVEIINMGDIIATGGSSDPKQQLFTATKHVNGVAPCTQNILESIVSANTSDLNKSSPDGTEAGAAGRLAPNATGGLFANVTVINVADASAWAIEATPVQDGPLATRYWSQTEDQFTGLVANVTLDGIFLTGAVLPAQYDFPDLSTPRGVTANTAAQFAAINGNIGQPKSVANEYITDDSISAATDWVFSFPTRRYAVEGRGIGNTSASSYAPVLEPFATAFRTSDRCLSIDKYNVFDREEQTTTTGVVISPGQVRQLFLCGEVAVWSFNNGTGPSSAVGAELTKNDITSPYADGWLQVNFKGEGLPVIASAFVKANNGGGATAHNFGGNWKHRVVGGGE